MRISDWSSDVCSADLVAVAFANKMLPALLLARAHGWRKAIAAGLLLSVRLSLIVAASDIATRIGVFDAATNAAMVLVAIISAVVAPLLFNVLIEEQPEGDTTRDQPASDNVSALGAKAGARAGLGKTRMSRPDALAEEAAPL